VWDEITALFSIYAADAKLLRWPPAQGDSSALITFIEPSSPTTVQPLSAEHRRWWQQVDPATARVFYAHEHGASQWDRPTSDAAPPASRAQVEARARGVFLFTHDDNIAAASCCRRNRINRWRRLRLRLPVHPQFLSFVAHLGHLTRFLQLQLSVVRQGLRLLRQGAPSVTRHALALPHVCAGAGAHALAQGTPRILSGIFPCLVA
jgi:hypothetical protein